MNEFIGYVLKSGLSLIVLYFFYWAMLRKDTHFRLNRSVLLFSLLSSLLVPIVNIYIIASEQLKAEIPMFYASINEVIIKSTAPATASVGNPINWWRIVTIIYGIGAFVVMGRLVYQAIYLRVMTKLSKTIRKGEFTIVVMNADITPFAYFNKIFIPVSKADDVSIETIVSHERAHQQQLHYVDLFIMELVTVIQWFNPIVWLYERSLKETHEYLADETVLKRGQHKGEYQALLVNEALGGPVFSLTNQFNQSLIKKRIRMMTKMKSPRLSQLKALLVFPLMMLILVAFANPNGVIQNKIASVVLKDTVKIIETKATPPPPDADGPLTFVEKMPEFPGGVDSMMHYLGKNIKYPSIAMKMGIQGRVVAQFVVDKTGKVSNIKIIRALGGGCDEEAIRVIKAMPLWKPGYDKGKLVSVYFTLPVIFALNENAGNKNIMNTPDEDTPQIFVEQMPEYPGGKDAMMKFLKDNIKYPEEAKKKGIEGKVVLQFVVDKSGKLSNIKIIRSLGGGCDEEAIRVVSSMPTWKPGFHNGKQVSVFYTLPMIFELDENVNRKEVIMVKIDSYDFPEGKELWNSFLKSNLKLPKSSGNQKNPVNVLVIFELHKTGNISNIRIFMPKEENKAFENEAIRLVGLYNKWKPSSVGDESVTSKDVIVSIDFQ